MTTILIVDAPSADTTALIERIMSRALPEAAIDPDLPSPFVDARPGERYAGVVLVEGKPSHHLFLLDAKPAGKLDWKGAQAWAEGVGAELPTRFEAALLYAHLKDQFETSDYYWTATQYSDAYAWVQYFNNGYQGFNAKHNEFLARAVRRLEI